jgi:hypothetical protein
MISIQKKHIPVHSLTSEDENSHKEIGPECYAQLKFGSDLLEISMPLFERPFMPPESRPM